MDYAQELISRYKEFLISQGVSTNTLKNYASDLRTFITFLSSQNLDLSPDNLTQLTAEEKIREYENYLSRINPSATVNRRISSLRKFISFSIQSGLAAPQPPAVPAAPAPAIPTPPLAASFPPPAPASEPSSVTPVPAYSTAAIPAEVPPFTPIPNYDPSPVAATAPAVAPRLPSDLPPPPAQSHPHSAWTPLPPSIPPAPVSEVHPVQAPIADTPHPATDTPAADLVHMIPHIFPESTFTPHTRHRHSPWPVIVAAVASFTLAFLLSWFVLSQSNQINSKDIFSLSKVFNQQQSQSESASGLVDPTQTSLSE